LGSKASNRGAERRKCKCVLNHCHSYMRGLVGAAVSFIGFGLPAFLLMTVLSALYVRTSHLPAPVSLFSGLQAIIAAVIGNATVSFGRTSLKPGGTQVSL
jgi:chromate transport protein ChrA